MAERETVRYIIPKDEPCCIGGDNRYKNCVRYEFLEEYDKIRESLRSFKKLPVTICYTAGTTAAQMKAGDYDRDITWQLEKIVEAVVKQPDPISALLKHNIVELRLMGFYLLLLGIIRNKNVDKSRAIILSTRKFLGNIEKKNSPIAPQCIEDIKTILQRVIETTGFTEDDVIVDSEYDQYLMNI